MTLQEEERKSCFIIIRVKKIFKEILLGKAKQKGITLSMLIREILKKYGE